VSKVTKYFLSLYNILMLIMIMSSNKYCVIMAGGIGSRFWPISRRENPKQFLDILGTGKSFIRHTYERFVKIVPSENFLIVTNRIYKDLVMEHIPEIETCQKADRGKIEIITKLNLI